MIAQDTLGKSDFAVTEVILCQLCTRHVIILSLGNPVILSSCHLLIRSTRLTQANTLAGRGVLIGFFPDTTPLTARIYPPPANA